MKYFKCSEINLEKFKAGKSGKFIPIKYDNQPLYLLMPKMKFFIPAKYEKLRLSLYFGQGKSQCQQFFQELDEYVAKLAYTNRFQWFSDEPIHNLDFVSFFDNYHQQIQYENEKSCIRVNLPTNLHNIVYDCNNKQMENPLQELLFSQSKISIIIKCKGIWINEETFGLYWEVVQMKLFPIKHHPRRASLPLDP